MIASHEEVAAELRGAIANNQHYDPSVFYRVERQCVALLRKGDQGPTAIFVAAQIARTLASRLDDESVEVELEAYWATVGNSLADAIERHIADPSAAIWAELIWTLYPPDANASH